MVKIYLSRFAYLNDLWTWHNRNRCSTIRNGAYDFIEKPFKEERLLMMVARTLQSAKLARENIELKALMIDGVAPELIGKSPVMRVFVKQLVKLPQPPAGCLSMDKWQW